MEGVGVSWLTQELIFWYDDTEKLAARRNCIELESFL